MLFTNSFIKRIKQPWLRLILEALIFGLIVAFCLICLFAITKNNFFENKRTIIGTLVFSVLIPFSISCVIHATKNRLLGKVNFKWLIPIYYYSAVILGMFIGTELSYLVFSVIFNFDFEFLSHYQDYKFNLLISIIVGTIVYVNNTQKNSFDYTLKDKEVQLVKLNELKMKADLQVLQAKINPHFLYNALNSIASLIHDEPEKAEDMTIRLSKLFRHSLNSNNDNWVTVKDELEIIGIYIEIERVRFQDKMTFEMEVNPEVLNTFIPRFLIQPLIENAIKHGLMNLQKNGFIKLILKKLNERLIISVHDNGIQFPNDLVVGYGIQSTYNKLDLLYPEQYEIQLNNGLYKEIRIDIPIKQSNV